MQHPIPLPSIHSLSHDGSARRGADSAGRRGGMMFAQTSGRTPTGASTLLLRSAVLLLCASALAACSSNRTDTAMQVIQHQQEQQSMLRQHEADVAKKNAPSEPTVVMAMIRESQDQQRYFASLAYIDAYAQQFGDNVELSALRANALRMTDQTAQSEAAYQALLKTSEAATGWHGLGLLAASKGNFAQAADQLAKATKLRPTNAEFLNDLGFARLQAGDINGARLPLGQAAELDPANNKVLANLALLLLVQGEPEQAHAVMDKARLSQQARDQVQKLAGELHNRPTQTASLDEAPVTQDSAAEASAASAVAVAASAPAVPVVSAVPPASAASGVSPAPAVAAVSVATVEPVATNTTQTAGSTPAPLSRPIVTAVSTAPEQAAPVITPSSPVGFHQAPLMERYSPLVR